MSFCQSTAATALEIAYKKGDTQRIELWLSKGVNLKDAVEFVFRAPKFKQKEILELLIKYGKLNSKYRDEKNYNYIQKAFVYAYPNQIQNIDIVEIVRLFLNIGVSIDKVDDHVRSPLACAIYFKNFELVTLLVNKGANVNEKIKKKDSFRNT